jgi:hypothetical protein
MTENEKIIVASIDAPEIEAERPIKEEVASDDQFVIEAVAFWREYLRQPKRRKAKTYRSRTSGK